MTTSPSESNRVETFDEKYYKVIQEMNEYLRDNGLNMISWTDDNANSFKIHLSKKYFTKKNKPLTGKEAVKEAQKVARMFK